MCLYLCRCHSKMSTIYTPHCTHTHSEIHNCLKSRIFHNYTHIHCTWYTHTPNLLRKLFALMQSILVMKIILGCLLSDGRLREKKQYINSFHCRGTFIKICFSSSLVECSKQHVWAVHAIIKTCFCKQPSILVAGKPAYCPWRQNVSGHSLWSNEEDNYRWPLPIAIKINRFVPNFELK